MADKGIPVAEATSGTLDKIDMKQATNANSETVYQQRVVIAADETPAIANPLPVQGSDGTNAQAFKAASTESAFTDVAAVATLRPSENHIGEVGSPLATPSANFNRPANTTAYASGQLVANSTTLASVAPMQFTVARVAAGSVMVRRAKLKKSGTSTTNASFRLHLFTSIPDSTSGGLTSADGAALAVNANGYLGAIDLDMTSSSGRVWADCATVHGVPNTGSEISVKLASGQVIYGLLEARGAYTPVSGETFTVTLESLQN